eukprot:Platyproteum_vivax@DN3162_c0_g1_i1.p1
MNKLGRLSCENTVFLVCDLQDAFPISAILKFTANFMIKAAKILDIPVIVTEQYPQGLGHTCKDIDLSLVAVPPIHKTSFSMINDEVMGHIKDKSGFVLLGIESHVCIQQTALDLLALESTEAVHLLTDGCYSQRDIDHTTALRRLQAAGCILTTSESVLFDLMKSKQHPKFKEISNLCKEANKTRPDYSANLSAL